MKSLPLKVWAVTFAYALMMTGSPLMVLVSGIIGARIAPSPSYATLPMALTVVGLALAALATARLVERIGRRKTFVLAGLLAIVAAVIGSASLSQSNFLLYCLSSIMIGASMAAVHQYRFMVIAMVDLEHAPVAASTLLLGGLLAAIVGPEIAVAGRDLMAAPFAASYLLLAVVYTLGLVVIACVTPGETTVKTAQKIHGNPWQFIRQSPLLIVAIAASAVGYAVMSFVMTATPISMHDHSGHSLEATKLVIQCHIAAMFLPSLFSGYLIKRFGYRLMLWSGLTVLCLSLFSAFMGASVAHFWVALVLLGIGWNFLFVSGTALLALGCNSDNAVRIQGNNEMLVFGAQALASLSSGWFLYHFEWKGMALLSLPLLLILACLLVIYGAHLKAEPNNNAI